MSDTVYVDALSDKMAVVTDRVLKGATYRWHGRHGEGESAWARRQQRRKEAQERAAKGPATEAVCGHKHGPGMELFCDTFRNRVKRTRTRAKR